MTYWIVTTGDSLRTSSRCWTLPGQERLYDHDDQPMAAFLDPSIIDNGLSELLTWQQRRREIVDDAMGQDPSQFQNRATDLIRQYFRSECWTDGRRHTLPAELATLHRLRDEVTSGDTIRLIAGPSNLKVGRLLEAALEYLATVAPSAFPTRNILCDPTYDLDPLASATFNSGMAALWDELRPLLSGPSDTRLVLTGGYKAIAISLALHVGKSIKVPRPIYYLYEDTSSQVITLRILDNLPRPRVVASVSP